jgi:hypothetical protein
LTLSLTSLTPSFPSRTSFPMPSPSPTPHHPAHIQLSAAWISSVSLLWTLTSASALSSAAPHRSSFSPSPATSHPACASHPVDIPRCATAPLTATSKRPPSLRWLAGSGTSPHPLPSQSSHLSFRQNRLHLTSVPLAVAPSLHAPSLHRWCPLLSAALALLPYLAPHSHSHPLLSHTLCLFPPFPSLTFFVPLHRVFLVPLHPCSPIGPSRTPVTTPKSFVSHPPTSFGPSALPTVSPFPTIPLRPWDLRVRPSSCDLPPTPLPSSTWMRPVSPSRSAPPLPVPLGLSGLRAMGRS